MQQIKYFIVSGYCRTYFLAWILGTLSDLMIYFDVFIYYYYNNNNISIENSKFGLIFKCRS